jgi:hypothetical protein
MYPSAELGQNCLAELGRKLLADTIWRLRAM